MNSTQNDSIITEPSALDALRAATAAAHVSLEAALGMDRVDRDGYRNLLARFLGVYEPIEQRWVCYAQGGWLDDVDRRKVPWLIEDLKALGFSRVQIDALPRCPEIPALTSAAAQLGGMYVIEGSTLGGTHIAKGVLPRLNISLNTGGAFFHSYGAQVGHHWKAYLHALQQRVLTPRDRDEAVRGASETFSLLHQWLAPSEKSRNRA